MQTPATTIPMPCMRMVHVISAAMLDVRTHLLVTTIQTSWKTMVHATTPHVLDAPMKGRAITIRFSRWTMDHAITAAWDAQTKPLVTMILRLQVMMVLVRMQKPTMTAMATA